MGKKLHIILLILGIPALFMAQTVNQQMLSAKTLRFHHLIYVYGYQQSNSELLFKCISYNDKLQLKDTVHINLGKHSPSDYLEISVDTLHNVLNFYFQLANQKNEVSLLRLNDSLRQIGSAQNYDANHINALSVFDDEKYAFKDDLYIIRTSSDTSGKQFYLSRYHVKDMNKPFEYEYKWQFAFERKYIYRASIIYADSNMVMVYAHVYDGLKKGQWILRINANTGEVIRGTKLSAKSDSRHFLMSNVIIDKKNKSVDVIGSIYEANMIDFKSNTSNFTNQSKNHKLFLVVIDSTGDVVSRVEKSFPMPVQTKAGNILQSFHLKIREFNKKKDGSYAIWSDVYEQTLPNVFTYYSSWQFNIVPNDVDYEIVRSVFTISTKAVPHFTSLAKGDTYGKFILNDIGEYDKFKYKKPMNNVVIKTGLDSLNNAFYILKKTDIVSSKKTYHYIFMGKKNLESKPILKSEQGQNVNIYFTGVTSYVSFLTNIGNTGYELKTNSL
ncbi:MAG: hypothetical protein K0S26_1881 [Bacteroidota bacterium]|jgi:hypothetical protein|nr:hypothetical protein [Bacteroidota bacterium]